MWKWLAPIVLGVIFLIGSVSAAVVGTYGAPWAVFNCAVAFLVLSFATYQKSLASQSQGTTSELTRRSPRMDLHRDRGSTLVGRVSEVPDAEAVVDDAVRDDLA